MARTIAELPAGHTDHGLHQSCGIRMVYDASDPELLVGGLIEYGAVERYSGVSSIGDGYRIDLAGNASDFDPAPFMNSAFGWPWAPNVITCSELSSLQQE